MEFFLKNLIVNNFVLVLTFNFTIFVWKMHINMKKNFFKNFKSTANLKKI